MKHPLSLLLAALLALLTLGACGSSPGAGPRSSAPETTITVEQMEEQAGMPVLSVLLDTHMQPGRYNQISTALEGLPGFDRDFKVNIEMLPHEGAQRETMATRFRTEIMAGKGPDLFLCGSNRLGLWGESFSSEPFFRFPEQAMDNHLFLPLDDFIENAEYMDWDSLLPQVMEAGRNQEGQMILPMAYSLSLTFSDKAEYTPTLAMPCSWDDMMASDDPVILCAANWGLSSLLGQVADYSTDTLLISEEEFLTRAKEELALRGRHLQGLADAPGAVSGYWHRTRLLEESQPFPMGDNDPEYHMIPQYNVQGGVTTYVVFYAAINRSARHPELAFKVADYLLGKRVQQNSTFYRELMEGMPVCQELGSKNAPLDGGWSMSEANFQEFQNLLSQINQVKFPGALETALSSIHSIPGRTSEKELEKLAHEQYVLMQMLLAES